MDSCSIIHPWALLPEARWITEAFTHDTDDALTKAHLLKPNPAVSSSTSDFKPTRGPGPLPPSRKIRKRQPRTTNRSPRTTYIAADPANFRHLVQQVTGVHGEPVVKPEPDRVQDWCLPTLDTSAFLLERGGVVGSVGPVRLEGPAFDFESMSSFPTLESWSVKK